MPLRIDRPSLTTALLEFAGAGHGLVVGRAGVGKSFSLSLLARELKQKGTAHLILAVENLGEATEDAVRTVLGYKDDSFSTAISSLFDSAASGVVILDGFDAARDEAARNRVLDMIRTTIRRAPAGWTLLVSVRDYDAKKSPTLIGLFPRLRASPPVTFQAAGITSRHFLIPELTDGEVKTAIAQVDGLEALYSQSTVGFHRLCRIPFNLWLLEQILADGSHAEAVRHLDSEVQLLDLYWSTRVIHNHDAEHRLQLLTIATSEMIETRSLRFRTVDVFSTDRAAAWHALFSADVLSETGPGKEAAHFTHNILFDYAVSVLCVPDTAETLRTFLVEDPSRPLFLRPSLLYHFIHLWHSERPRFWQTFWDLLEAEALAVRLVARLLPPYVIATEARSISDLQPLVQRLKELQQGGADAVLRVLQALRFAEVTDPSGWLEFAVQIAALPDPSFAWELASYLSRALSDPKVAADAHSSALVGQASRRLCDWSWTRREINPAWYDVYAASQVVPLVLKTCETDVAATTSVVRRILGLLSEADFPVRYLVSLSEGIVALASVAPGVVADVYRATFAYKETSDAPTAMGGIVLRFRSNRKQDVAMCRYALARDFSSFLEKAPDQALATGIDLLNAYSRREHLRSESGDAEPAKADTFVFRGDQRRYLADWSVGWSQSLGYEDIGTVANAIGTFLDEGEIVPEHAADIAAAHAETAYTWALLLEAGTRAPSRYGSALFDLTLARPIQMGSDTRHLLASFIEAAAPYWSGEQCERFQQDVLQLSEGGDSADRARRSRVADLLLTRLPAHLLTVQKAKERVEVLVSTKAIPENEPAVRSRSFSRTLTPEIWLSEQGVDLSLPENASAVAIGKTMKAFTELWANKNPPVDAIQEFLPTLSTAFSDLRTKPALTGAAPEAIEHAWTHLAGAAHAFSRSNPAPDSPAFQVSRDALMHAATFSLGPIRPGREKEFETPSWSLSPRTEAIQGLATLAFQTSTDHEIVASFIGFVDSAEPAERYLAAMYLQNLFRYWPEDFWGAIKVRAAEESNAAVVMTLIRTIWGVTGSGDQRGADILRSLLPRWLSTTSASLRQAVAFSLAQMAFVSDDSWSWDIIRTVQNKRAQNGELLSDILVEGIHLLAPRINETSDRQVERRVIDWLLQLLQELTGLARAAREWLASHPGGDAATVDPSVGQLEARKDLGVFHDLIGEITRRVYFAARIDKRPREKDNVSIDEKAQADRLLREYFEAIRPVMREIVLFSGVVGAGALNPSTAHEFMQLLNIFVSFSPTEALAMAAAIATAASTAGYQFDSLAVKEVVRLVEIVLADHRDALRKAKPLEDTLRLLDIFADAGWPEALQLVWRLDEVFR